MKIKDVIDLIPPDRYVYIVDVDNAILDEASASGIVRQYHDYDVGQLIPTFRNVTPWKGPQVQIPAVVIKILRAKPLKYFREARFSYEYTRTGITRAEALEYVADDDLRDMEENVKRHPSIREMQEIGPGTYVGVSIREV